MKKVVGIFMAMVLVFVFVSMAMAENPKGYSGSEVIGMVKDWIKSQKCEQYLIGDFDQGVKYEYGVICTSDFKELTGEEFTFDGLKKVYYNGKNYGADFNASDVEIKLVGFIEGYDVYILNIKTKTPLGNENGIDYYRGSAVFMICEDE